MTNDKFEKLVKEIMAEAEADGEPITYEDAVEMAKMEVNAKVNCKTYAQNNEKPRKKPDKPKVVKVSDEKKALFIAMNEFLNDFSQKNNATVNILIENKMFSVEFGGETFKIDLVQQRKPKK